LIIECLTWKFTVQGASVNHHLILHANPNYHNFDDAFSEQQELPASSFLVSFTSVEAIFRFEGTSMLGFSEKKSTGLK
jgi:hypothetical protein